MFAVFLSFAQAADQASLCRVGAVFKKFDAEPAALRDRLDRGSTLATDPVLCQVQNGERFVVVQFDPSAKSSFIVLRGADRIEAARKILLAAGYNL